MAYFAKLDLNNIVTDVIALDNAVFTVDGVEIEQKGVDFLNNLYGTSDVWKQTSYNTRGGIYYIPNSSTPDPDQSKAFRKNYAGVGYLYNEQQDAFITPKPYPSFIYNSFSASWDAPIAYPSDYDPQTHVPPYIWDETTLSWVLPSWYKQS